MTKVQKILIGGFFGFGLLLAVSLVFVHFSQTIQGTLIGPLIGWFLLIGVFVGTFCILAKQFGMDMSNDRMRRILLGSAGVASLIINLSVYRPYFEAWGSVLNFLVVEKAAGMIVLMVCVATGLFGPVRNIEWRRIIGWFVVISIAFDFLSWMWLAWGVTVPDWGLRPLHTYGNPYQKFWAFVIISLVMVLITIQWSGIGRRAVGFGFKALGLMTLSFIAAGIGIVVLFIAIAVWNNGLPALNASVNASAVSVPSPNDTSLVSFEVTSFGFTPVPWKGNGQEWQNRMWGIKGEDEIGLWQRETIPKEGDAPDLILKGSDLGPVDDSWQTKPNGKPCLKNSTMLTWLRSMKASSTIVHAVYSRQRK